MAQKKPVPQNTLKKLHKAAVDAFGKAYAPYSHFHVGAALLDTKGKIYKGCNVENSSYGATVCAERSALSQLVVSGGKEIKAVMVVSTVPDGCPPCGICRQSLAEFAGKTGDIEVHMATTTKILKSRYLSELLPLAFGKGFLGK